MVRRHSGRGTLAARFAREGGLGGETLVTFSRNDPGAECPSRPGEDCLAPPRSRLSFSWPKETTVRVPATFFMHEVLLHAKVGGRTVLGLVDSGATVNVVDTGSPLVSAFREAQATAGSTPGGSFAQGEIDLAVELGDLSVRHLPAAAVPIPSFDEFGDRRPQMLVGYPIFLGTAVRLDFALEEVLLSRRHGISTRRVPLRSR